MLDRRFPTALQMMQSLVLAERRGTPVVSSAQLSDYLAANPTLVRKLQTTLVQKGLLTSQLGRRGGVRLARSAETITLRQIFEAAVSERPLWTARPNIPHRCVVSTNFPRYFSDLVRLADGAVLDALESQTLAESFTELMALEAKREDGPAQSSASKPCSNSRTADLRPRPNR